MFFLLSKSVTCTCSLLTLMKKRVWTGVFLPWLPSRQEHIGQSWSRNFGRHYLLAGSCLCLAAFLTQHRTTYLPRGSTAHIRPSSLTPVINNDSVAQTWVKASLVEAILQLKFCLLGHVKSTKINYHIEVFDANLRIVNPPQIRVPLFAFLTPGRKTHTLYSFAWPNFMGLVLLWGFSLPNMQL